MRVSLPALRQRMYGSGNPSGRRDRRQRDDEAAARERGDVRVFLQAARGLVDDYLAGDGGARVVEDAHQDLAAGDGEGRVRLLAIKKMRR